MDRPEKLSAALCDDDVVCYLAGRYHTTPREVVESFLAGEGFAAGEDACCRLCLEENELAILRGLAARVAEAGCALERIPEEETKR